MDDDSIASPSSDVDTILDHEHGHDPHTPNRQFQRRRDRSNRKNVSQACDRCRARKIKCSGEHPACERCNVTGHACVYSTEIDKRTTDRSARETIRKLRDRVKVLEDVAGKAAVDMQVVPMSSPFVIEHDELDSAYGDESEPFSTGRLVLSSTGNLHLFPEATFYRPAHVVPEWQHILKSLNPRPPVARLPGYLASYLPFPMAEHHHRCLIDTAFETLLSFGPNPFRDKFVAAMETDVDSKGLYFSPILHLCIIGVGWRNCRDPQMLAMYYPTTGREKHGEEFINRARDMVLAEVNEPHLSTILALFVMTLFYVGIKEDSRAGACFSMGQYLCMDFRLHRRCDPQLVELGTSVDSELDVARRDVWGFAHNFNAWWSTFYAQATLPMSRSANQRAPHVWNTHPDTNTRLLSMMASRHVSLSTHALDALDCNHLLRMPMDERIKLVYRTRERLVAWRASLPSDISWPPSPTGPVMPPGNIVTHGMYSTYMILLFRPYLIEVGGGRPLVPDALDICMQGAKEIVEQGHYMVKHHGYHRAPLTWQQTIYVCGTMLVLQASGLSGVTSEQAKFAFNSLSFLQTALREFAYVWPAAEQTAESLRQLELECNPIALATS